MNDLQATALPPPSLLPPPTPQFQPRKRLSNWGVAGLAVAGTIGLGVIVTVWDNTESPSGPLEPSDQTCGNLQSLIDAGWSKRAAIDYAVLQADEPGADGILRNMLEQCEISR